MTATDLVTDLEKRGVRLTPAGDHLAYEAPAGVLTDDVVAELKAQKREILKYLNGRRCAQCRELEAQGIRTLICSTCGYSAPRTPIQPTADDLVYPLAYVREQVPTWPKVYRERFDYWVDLMRGEGWSQEQAERGAFRRVLRSKPAGRSHTASQLRLHDVKEAG